MLPDPRSVFATTELVKMQFYNDHTSGTIEKDRTDGAMYHKCYYTQCVLPILQFKAIYDYRCIARVSEEAGWLYRT